ncbi:MAG TPA: cytochrome c oxidase subunit II [Actinomycetota bacterium]|jgi:cytochrome c oxidase subunit 2
MSFPNAKWKRLTAVVFAVGLALLLTGCATDGPQDYLNPQGPNARQADNLWNLTFGIAVVVFVIVEALIVYALVKFRHRPGREAAQFHGNTRVEVILTLVPALILAGIAIPTVKTIFDLSRRPGGDALEVTVEAHQFWWEFHYPELEITTANEMHIPVDRPIDLTLKGVDVIHSFWIPRLAGKQDVVPGHTNHMHFQADEPGRYLGQCTEFCGLSHANMRQIVFAHEVSDFEEWVANEQEEAREPSGGLAAEGARLFVEGTGEGTFPNGGACGTCHAIAGTTAQGVMGPDLTHFASRETFAGATYDSTPANLRSWLEDPPAMKPGVDMPDLGLTAEQIDALMAYLETLE